VPTERARRPVASRLALAIARGENLDEAGLPITVVDAGVEQTFDVYENRVIRTFHAVINRRLSRFIRSLRGSSGLTSPESGSPPNVYGDARSLQRRLDRARQRADFLDEVQPVPTPPDHLSMVLLNRPTYRAALELYHEFMRSVWVRIEEPALDGPIDNFPHLYQVWGTLHVVHLCLEVAAACGYQLVGEQQLALRDADGLYVRLVPNGRPILELRHPSTGVQVRLIPQSTYSSPGTLRSISFNQVPDVTLEVMPPIGPTRLYLFDPKYKLDGDPDASSDGTPKKEDIDKMHAYRDAIRGLDGQPVVRYAAILYPGPLVTYSLSETNTPEIAALPADPARPDVLDAALRVPIAAALEPGDA